MSIYPAFPDPQLGYPGLTNFEYYAAHAPVEIPSWYNTYENSTPEERFFKWRVYYAKTMCETAAIHIEKIKP
jgi:hypothetical protein